MGQIVIDIPSNKNRRFVLEDAKQAELLLAALETAAIRVKSNPAKKLSRQDLQNLQDLRDGQRADRILADMRRTGISYTTDDLREKYGL